MFDHVTIRVPDLAAATSALTTVLDELEIPQSTSTASFSIWGNFAITQTDDEHPIARRVHVAFIAPTPLHVDRFAQAGIDAGLTDDGPAGPRLHYAEDYYAAYLKDPQGNSFEAVHRDRTRPGGYIDHVAIRVDDLDASTMFYWTISDSVGLSLRRQTRDLVEFALNDTERSLLVIAGEPTENVHIAFSGTLEEIRRFYEDATAAGYRNNGQPGERPALPRRLLLRLCARPGRQQHRSSRPPTLGRTAAPIRDTRGAGSARLRPKEPSDGASAISQLMSSTTVGDQGGIAPPLCLSRSPRPVAIYLPWLADVPAGSDRLE